MTLDSGRDDATRCLCAIVGGHTFAWPPSVRVDVFLDLAEQHRLGPLLAWQCRDAAVDLNGWLGPAAASFQQGLRVASVTDAVQNAELTRVCDALDGVGGAAPVLFKGAALAQTHYPAPWLRPRLDSDIFISPASRHDVFARLQALGYEHRIKTAFVNYQALFERRDDLGVEHSLDVHWKMSNRDPVADVLSHADIAARAAPLPGLGPRARGACAADALILAAVHRAAHHYDTLQLLWIYDVHCLAERLSAAEWDAVRAVAERSGIRRILGRAMALAIESFDTRIPDDIVRSIDAWNRMPNAEPSSMYLAKDVRPWRLMLADLRSLGPAKGMRRVVEHLFPPADYLRNKYPSRSRLLMPFWYAWRILGGARRFLRRTDAGDA
jgi:hypothetical protein